MSEYIVKDRPTVMDNDRGQVLIYHYGRQIRGWSYQNADEQRKKMGYAHEYIEGWCDGRDYEKRNHDAIKGIHIRHKLRNVLSSFSGETLTKDKREMIVRAFWPEPEDQ